MNKLSLALTVALAAACGALHAQNDSWEPNNSAAAATPMINHIGSAGEIAGIQFSMGPTATGPATQTRNLYEDSVILPADEDWYQITAPINATLTVHMYQTNTTPIANRLVMQILNQTGTLVHAGPSAGTYSQLSTLAPSVDRFDGARAQVAATAGTVYNIKVFHPPAGGTLPAGSRLTYALTVEWGTPDASESTYSNNFPGQSPEDASGQEADATPTAPGAANARVLTNRSYNGMDYYIVRLNQPATITFQIENLVPLAPQFNFDVYWVEEDGTLLSNVLVNGTAMQGAEDSFPNGWPALAVVNNPRPVETLTTPPLVPGAYYFHVMCWNLAAGVNLPLQGGNYGVRCTITGQTDDTLEGVAANQNDSADKATTLPAGQTNNLRLLNGTNPGLTAADPRRPEEDWYKVAVPNGQNLEIRITVAAPDTDDLNIELYKPNAVSPGAAADRIDWSNRPNPDIVTKGASTPREIVGTWGTVGVNGNASLPDGDFLVRITRVGLLLNCGYSMTVTIPGTVNIAREDLFEPNDDLGTVTAVNSTYLELPLGYTGGLKAMDQFDMYRFPCGRNQNVQVTLRYDAGPDVDLDLILLDLNGGPDWAANQNFAFLGAPNLTVEINPGTLAQVQATTGTSWTAAGKIAPQTGLVYIIVQRWGTRGAKYELNINVNNGNPMPPLVVDQISATPPTIAVPNSTNIAVAVRNQGAFDTTLQAMNVKLTHSSGADVTSEYTISNPTPALPELIMAAQTNIYAITVTATAATTSGQIRATVSGSTDTGLPLVGQPSAVFTVTGGLAPIHKLVYEEVEIFGTLKPAGVCFIRCRVTNEGTQGGIYENNVINFNFSQAAANVTSGFGNLPIGVAPQLPAIVGAGTSLDVVFTFAIKKTVGIGLTSVTISGGGAQNPVNPATKQFQIQPQFATKSPPDSGCAAGSGIPFAPPVAALMMAGLAFFRRRRGK